MRSTFHDEFDALPLRKFNHERCRLLKPKYRENAQLRARPHAHHAERLQELRERSHHQ